MAHIYKKKTLKPLPEKHEIIYRRINGQSTKLAKLIDVNGHKKEPVVHADGQRIIVESSVWYMKFRDSSGIVCRESTGCTTRKAAEKSLADRVEQAEQIRRGILSPDVVRATDQAQIPLPDHIADYLSTLAAKTFKGRQVSAAHVDNVDHQLERIKDDCGFRWLIDVNRDALARWMAQQLKSEAMSNRTINTYRSAWLAFCRWCVESGRMLTNPLEGLQTVENTESNPRRSLTVDELTRLLEAARVRPLSQAKIIRKGPRKGQPYANLKTHVEQRLIDQGAERALLYRTMAFTGLRRNEIATLTVKDLCLDQDMPYVSLRTRNTKNAQADQIPLKADLAETLRQWIANKLPNAKAFFVPQSMSATFDKDLEFARITKTVDDEVACPHSLRHTFASMLAQAGVSPQKAMRLLRHSDINLTAKRYTHIEMTDKAQAIASLPDITPGKNESSQKTGTDNFDTEVTREVTSNSQKVGKTGNNCPPSSKGDELPKLIKPRFSAEKEAFDKSGWRESNPHDQLGRLDRGQSETAFTGDKAGFSEVTDSEVTAEVTTGPEKVRISAPVSPSDITTLADLLSALPSSDRADIIAGLPQDQRLAVARLLAKRITEDNTHE
jgi:integrase